METMNYPEYRTKCQDECIDKCGRKNSRSRWSVL